MALFTILLPVHRPPALLPYAVRSVQQQEFDDFELVIICDGAPRETGECALAFESADPRIRALVYPKGERHGEAYRHEALKDSDSTYVCQIADDDIWFPSHLTEMAKLLETVDFGHFPQVYVTPEGSIGIKPSNLADENQRKQMCETKFNTFGPSECGYRMSAYRKLPEGWAPAPSDIWTDLHMWRKFLITPGLTFTTRYVVAGLHFPSPPRQNMSLQQRVAENEHWFQSLQAPEVRERVAQQAFQALSGAASRKQPLEKRVKDCDKRIDSLNKKVERLENGTKNFDKQIGCLKSEVEKHVRRARALERKASCLRDDRAQLVDQVRYLKRVKNYYQRSRIWKIVEIARQARRRAAGMPEPAWLKDTPAKEQ